jgi:hypothetical protein
MNAIILTDLLGILSTRALDFGLIVTFVIWAIFDLRKKGRESKEYFDKLDRRQEKLDHVNADFIKTQSKHDELISSLTEMRHLQEKQMVQMNAKFDRVNDQFKFLNKDIEVFRLEVSERFTKVDGRFDLVNATHNNFRSEVMDFRREVKEEFKQVHIEIHVTNNTLKDIDARLKISDIQHNALETRVTKLESPDHPSPKSKQA